MSAHARRRTPLAAAIAVVLGGIIAIPSAQAVSTPHDKPSAGEKTHSRHCAVNAATRTEKCFDTYTEAIEQASGGRIDDAPASAREAVHDKGLHTEIRKLATAESLRSEGAATEGATTEGGVIRGTIYEDKQFGGDSQTIYGPGLCDGEESDDDTQLSLEEGWKNRVSSLEPWGGCTMWLHSEPDLKGDKDGPYKENTPDVGAAMEDRAQSVGFE
jgi:hypothetical protein